jgi:hypothetical protein
MTKKTRAKRKEIQMPRPLLSGRDALLDLGINKLEIDGRKTTMANSIKALAKNPDELKKLIENPEKLSEKMERELGLTLSTNGKKELVKLKEIIELGDRAALEAAIARVDDFIGVAADSSSMTASATASLTASGI